MSKKGGGFNMRAETLALASDRPLRFRRKHCETCAEEKLFRGMKCLSCGTMEKFRLPTGQVAHMKEKTKLATYLMRRQNQNHQINRDKYDAFRRAAEESRKKWEGK
jgi:hypothetical protein